MEFQLFKRQVYHKVLDVIFKSLKQPSQEGQAVTCGDGITRVFFPAIPIHSLDSEEAAGTCAVRGAAALYPCPRCLVYKNNLHKVLNQCSFRTDEQTAAVLSQLKTASSKTQAEAILQAKGLHNIRVCHYYLFPILSNRHYKECILGCG